MNQVTINGKTFSVPNGNISIVNNKIYVNDKLIEDFDSYKEKVIKITVEGDVNGNLECESGNVKVKGNVRDICTGSGDVNISGNILGNIQTGSGDVACNKIEGSVKTGSGDVVQNNFIKKILNNIFE